MKYFVIILLSISSMLCGMDDHNKKRPIISKQEAQARHRLIEKLSAMPTSVQSISVYVNLQGHYWDYQLGDDTQPPGGHLSSAHAQDT